MVNKYKFLKLTPVSDANISVYEDAIDFVFENDDIKNVSISGAYGAGKSSILESYKIKHSDKRFIHFSLAHFRTSEQDNSEPEETIKESILEGKILNQLIHQISADKIPQTNFRVKKGVNLHSLIKLTTFVSLFISSITFLLSADKISAYVGALPDNWIKITLSPFASQYALIPSVLVCMICFIAFTFSLIKAQKNKNLFRKISLQGNEIEIFEDKDESYFDKYLNEVLYLFEHADADVIVFEDMDRFNASRLFERLHEVNTLVNVQRKKEWGPKYTPLRFFYLLRDDIFISKDRTKFFDYIIPIVTVVDSSNSYEQFLKYLKEGDLLDRFDLSFLKSMSLYVDDMRILKNIYNEFVVYFNRLNTTDLDCKKMMAMITYKNLFPRDFCDLQLAKGFIYELFVEKDQLIDVELQSLQHEREELSQRIEKAKKETLTSEQELDEVYALKKQRASSPYGLTQQAQIQNKQYDLELSQRKSALADRSDSNLSKLEFDLTGIDQKIVSVRTKSLKDLITRENIDSVFSITHTNEIGAINEFKEIKCSDYFVLLKFLIRNGFIDETYTDYMTYFYDDSISASDKTFLRRVTDKRGAEYNYILRDPKKVIESPVLRTVEFEQEETLNFDLLEYLLQNDAEPKYTSYLKTLILQMRETKNFVFVSQYYDTRKSRRQFVMRINEQWASLFFIALEQQSLPANQIRQFSIETLCYSNDKSIEAVNAHNCLTEYISNSSDYLAIENPDIEKLTAGFLLIGVLFVDIDYESADKALFDEVYRLCLYKLNFPNISLMLRKEYQIKSDADITHKNYTMIQRHKDSPLASYISENMLEYIDIILKNCNGSIDDNEDIAVSLLNNAKVDPATKEQYIKFLSTVIAEIVEITDSALWTEMINCGRIAFSVKNSIIYFAKHQIDSAFIDFINSKAADADFSTTAEEFGEETADRLFDAVATCNEIDTVKYKKILIGLRYNFSNYEANGISDDKFIVLIGENILQMDADGLRFVREKYNKHIFAYIRQNLDEYLALQTAEIFSMNETLQLLTLDFSDEKKTELLTLTNDPISVVGKRYPDAVNAHLITYNLEVADNSSLYECFSTYGTQAQVAISALAISGVTEIITKNMKIDDLLLSGLLQADGVTRDQKITLFIIAIPTLNEDTCKNHFDELDMPDLKNIFTRGGGRRKYDKCKDVTTIFNALKTQEWIFDYKEDEQNCEKYIIIKNRPRSKEPEFLD